MDIDDVPSENGRAPQAPKAGWLAGWLAGALLHVMVVRRLGKASSVRVQAASNWRGQLEGRSLG